MEIVLMTNFRRIMDLGLSTSGYSEGTFQMLECNIFFRESASV